MSADKIAGMAPSSHAHSRPGWLLDEIASAGRENLDAGHASRYDSKEDAGASGEVQMLTRLGLTGESVVIDLGAGTGQFTLAVAPACGQVVAVDVSSVMLEVLRAKVDRTGLGNVEIAHAGFLTYAHRGRPADVVYSRYALHHLPDFWKGVALARMHRMLRPGGTLRLRDVVYSFEPAEAADRIEAWCSTGTSTDGGWARDELEEHVRDEHSTFSWLLEAMMLRAGFTIEDAEHSDDGIFAAYVLRRS
jgi:ubiquinone/menaquinone biosynthesis C-methylase UbiE